MITSFDDFCLWMYVVVDDLWQQLGPSFRRPGPEPVCSDSELLTMALVGECRGWQLETDLLSHWREHRDLFPHQPSQSRFNRRRRQLWAAFNQLRRMVLSRLDLALERQCVIDSLPVVAVQFHMVPGSTGDWAAYGASYGQVPSKHQTIYGYKLHLLLTLAGVIVDFELAPANVRDLEAGEELLAEHCDLDVLGDKAYISAPVADQLRQERGIHLLTVPRRNQKRQLPREICQLFGTCRQMIETVNDQLTEQFHVEVNHAHTFWGLATRLNTKLAAHTLSIYLNRLLGSPNPLHIKALAFPN